MIQELRSYIKNSWDKALNEKKDGELVLPYPFIPPCIEGDFRVLYYWDTYFTNIGLIIDGKKEYAKNNVDDLLFALDHFGCVPNYTRDDGAKFCSQPPFLRLMIEDVYKATNDKEWHQNALLKLEKEYAFWMKERMSPIGLNQYGTNAKLLSDLVEYYGYVSGRIPLPQDIPDEAKAEKAKNFLAEAESGEDFTPRYRDHNALDYVQIDLNAHLYGVEEYLAHCYENVDEEKSKYYSEKKEERLKLLHRYCYDEKTGQYYDYDFKRKERNDIVCCACFLPYFYGFAQDPKGVKSIYERLKTKGGVVACEDTGDRSYQWGYPNIWAPHQYFAYVALQKYGYGQEAEELRLGYIKLLEKEYDKTGRLWERYDENGIAKGLEYETQPMLGWTAGVYAFFTRTVLGITAIEPDMKRSSKSDGCNDDGATFEE